MPSDIKEIGQVEEQIQSKLSSCKDPFTVTPDDVSKAIHHMKSGKREGDIVGLYHKCA